MAASDDSRTVRLEVPARPDYVVLARLALSAVCRLTPLPPEDVADLKLAITEAAAAFIGEGDAWGAKLEESSPAEPLGREQARRAASVSFAFELGDRQLALEIGSPGGIVVSDEERALGRAIIDATVDECDYSDDTMRLVKLLEPPDAQPSPTGD